ncbi:MAG: hypothetical protein FWH05_03155 [Oscillospiraceae bacterium]|nr:hypothetical protein [Oscillospiraceae bacterium]
MTVLEKVAYIKGLAEGLKVDESTNEGKITLAILDVLRDIALSIEEYDETFDDMAEVVAELDERVELLEEEFDDDFDYSDYDDFDEDDLYEITCEECGGVSTVDYSVLQGVELACPKCGKAMDFFEDEDEDEEEPEDEA